MVMPKEERPPYVSFEVRSVEDRNATIAKGHWVGKDVAFVMITPVGSKDRIERVATEWLAEKRDHADAGRFPRKWYEAYKQAYELWLKDEEPPLDGQPIRNWPAVSPTQYKMLRDLRVLTVEDLAQANEETLSRIGPGARGLKATAVQWLEQASGLGMKVAEAEQLRIDNENLRGQVKELAFKHDQLAGLLQTLRPPAVVQDGASTSILDED